MNGQEYFFAEGLDKLIAVNAVTCESSAIGPDAGDLSRLHRLLRQRRIGRVLEFGVGFSTLVIADALAKNAAEFGGKGAGRCAADAHNVTSVDTNRKWISTSSDRIPDRLRGFVAFQYSPARVGTFNGQLCHYFDRLPDIVPEFVYLDGPDPRDVIGAINGVGFANPERTPLAADLLLLEPSLLPGTMVLVDGRTNNVRFLANNFSRSWRSHEDPDGDFATFELVEAPLGRRNRLRLEFCLGEDA